MGKHSIDQTARKKPWYRKRWIALGVAPVVALATTAGAAAAIYFALAGVTGAGTNASFTAKFAATPVSSDTAGLINQPSSGAKVTNGKLVLPAGLELYPGESFTVEAAVDAGGKKGYVSGMEFPGLPVGSTVELISGCGGSTAPNPAIVRLKFTMPATLAPGATWTLGSTAGVQVTPSTTTPAGVTCAPYTVAQ